MDIQLIVESGVTTQQFPSPSQVEVKEKLGDTTTYTISFGEDICEGNFTALHHPAFNPLKDISILVKLDNKSPILLVKGPVTKQQVSIVNGGQGSKLQVTGSDNTVKMSWATQKKNWAKHITKSDISGILDKYSFEVKHVLEDEKDPQKGTQATNGNKSLKNGQVQNDADLSFLKKQASLRSAYLWISYENKKEAINFSRLPLSDPNVKQKLIINYPDFNITELSLNWDANRPTSVKSTGVDLDSKNQQNVDIDQPPQVKLGNITLKDLTTGVVPANLVKPGAESKDLKSRGDAALNDAEWFLHLTCTIDFENFCDGDLFHAHTKVSLTGAGERYDGQYIVSAVTHTIDTVSYKVQLELQRNAWNRTNEEQPKK